MSVLIAPFFRASLGIGPGERALFVRASPDSIFLESVRRSAPILRQDLRRLFAAALLAEVRGGRLVFVEGWRSNLVIGPRVRRFVTGSWAFAILLRALARRRLLRLTRKIVRIDRSRCTAEEARAIAAVAASETGPSEVIGIADFACPSAKRAAWCLERANVRRAVVLTPEAAIAGIPLSGPQAAFWQSLRPRLAERCLSPLVEAPNWAVSVLAGPIEQRLAHALRPDRG